MTIRRAQVADIPALEKLLKEILLVHHQARPDLFRASGKKFSRQQLEALVPDDSKPIFVYEDEQGKILGHLFIIIENTEARVKTVSPTKPFLLTISVWLKMHGVSVSARNFLILPETMPRSWVVTT